MSNTVQKNGSLAYVHVDFDKSSKHFVSIEWVGGSPESGEIAIQFATPKNTTHDRALLSQRKAYILKRLQFLGIEVSGYSAEYEAAVRKMYEAKKTASKDAK